MRYDYRCRECLAVFEVNHSMTENPEVDCEVCGSKNTHKYLGNIRNVPIRFRGVGFAANDLALSKIGFPEHYKENPEVRKKLGEM